MGIFLGVAKISNILGCLIFLIFLFFSEGGGGGLNSKCWSKPVDEEK